MSRLVLGLLLCGCTGGELKLQGVPARGEAIYSRCQACHALDYDRTGPHHCGVVGRRAGSVADFAYSEAMRKSGLTWTPKELDRFLTAPFQAVPGTTMGYAGISEAQERADLIAWLAQQSCSEKN